MKLKLGVSFFYFPTEQKILILSVLPNLQWQGVYVPLLLKWSGHADGPGSYAQHVLLSIDCI